MIFCVERPWHISVLSTRLQRDAALITLSTGKAMHHIPWHTEVLSTSVRLDTAAKGELIAVISRRNLLLDFQKHSANLLNLVRFTCVQYAQVICGDIVAMEIYHLLMQEWHADIALALKDPIILTLLVLRVLRKIFVTASPCVPLLSRTNQVHLNVMASTQCLQAFREKSLLCAHRNPVHLAVIEITNFLKACRKFPPCMLTGSPCILLQLREPLRQCLFPCMRTEIPCILLLLPSKFSE